MPGEIIPRHMQQAKEKYLAKTPNKAAAEKDDTDIICIIFFCCCFVKDINDDYDERA